MCSKINKQIKSRNFSQIFPMRNISNYSSSQSMGPTEMLRKNKAPKKKKRGTSHGEKSPHIIVVSRGGRALTLAPLLRAPMSECDYI